jgi:sulfotransferase family protein
VRRRNMVKPASLGGASAPSAAPAVARRSDDDARNPAILITGAPRSGTTFLGTMLSLNRDVAYIYEPMSRVYGLRDVPDPLLYVRDGSSYEPRAHAMVSQLLAGHGRFRKPNGESASTLRGLARRLLGTEVSLRYRRDALNPLRKRWLIKDPWAALSSEWLHRRMGMPTVVLVRHPVPVVCSYRRLGWDMRIQELMSIDELMADHLGPLVDGVDVDALDPVENAALVWRAYYVVLNRYLDRNPEMIAVRHEDLSARPGEVLESLYRDLGLDFDDRVRARIAAYTGAGNQVATPGTTLHELRRDSAAVATHWRHEVDQEQRDRIRRWVEPESSRWYTDQDW